MLEFLYIDANVGGSSGGHAALKIDGSVYHFQNEAGYTRLVRDGWNHFRFVYNDIDNRNIHVARLGVDADGAERIGERLRLLFLVQNRHMEFLDALARDAQLLHRMARDEPFELTGVGFFARRAHEAASLHGLRADLARRFGARYLAAEEQRLARELAVFAYAPEPVRDPPPEADRYPRYSETLSERLETLYAHWYALAAIREEWPLRDGLLVSAKETEYPGNSPTLSLAEYLWLKKYRQRLVEAIVAGLPSRRSGSGPALLLAIARFMAVSESLASRKLLVLDALPAAPRAERLTYTEERRRPLEILLRQARTDLARIRREVFALAEPDEAAYNQIERAASQIAEIRAGLSLARPIRFLRRQAVPEGWGTALLPPPPVSPEDLEQWEIAAQARADAHRERIEALYPYDLIRRNCVTELVRAVDSAFESRTRAARAMGGYLEPGESLGFVPQRFFELVRQHYRIAAIATLPSYRNRKLGQFAGNGDVWAIRAAESNTWSSSLYHRREGDTLFLLFTEEVFWPRPLYGAINLAYGLGGTAVGVLAAPFDGGLRLQEGLRGALFSLPELVFGNIRKGSFDGVRSRTEGDSASVD